MAYDPVPRCPRCSGRTVKLVRETHRYSEQSRSRPVSTISVYDCNCGTGFTHQVKHDLPEVPIKTA